MISILQKTFSQFYKSAVLATSFLVVSNSYAEGLMITPTRVELDENTKSQEVRLINSGKEATSYRISFQNLRMNEDGSYTEITDKTGANEKLAEDYVKFSPKRVTLNPGESQAIRLMAKIPNENGEYRSHMLFKEEVPADSINSVEDVSKNKKDISVVLRPVFAISIPVIIRSGKVEAEVSLENPQIKFDKDSKSKLLNLVIKRTGNGSANGKIVANLVNKDSKLKTEILSVSNVSVFFPYDSRKISYAINLPKGIKLEGSTVEVKYVAAKKQDAKEGEPEQVLAQTSFATETSK